MNDIILIKYERANQENSKNGMSIQCLESHYFGPAWDNVHRQQIHFTAH